VLENGPDDARHVNIESLALVKVAQQREIFAKLSKG